MKLSNNKLKAIRRLADSGLAPAEIARQVGLPEPQVVAALEQRAAPDKVAERRPEATGAAVLEDVLAWCFVCFLAIAPLVNVREVAEAAKTPQETYLQYGTLLLLGAWLLLGDRRAPLRLGPRWLLLAMLGLVGWASLSLTWADNVRDGIERVLMWATGPFLYLAALNLLPRRALVERLIVAVFCSGVVVALIGLAQYYFGVEWFLQTARPGSTFVNENMAMHYIVMVVPLTFHLLVGAERWQQQALVSLGGAILLIYSFHSTTKAAWLSLAVAGAALGLWWGLQAWRRRAFTFGLARLAWTAALLAVVFCFINLTPTGFQWKLGEAAVVTKSTFSNPQKFVEMNAAVPALASQGSVPTGASESAEITASDSLAVRLLVWKNTIAMWQDHVLIGVGMGNFRTWYDRYARSAVIDTYWPRLEWHRTHNDFLQLLAELGIIGFVLLLAVVVALIWTACRALADPRDTLALVALLGLLGIAVNTCFCFPFDRTMPPMMVAVLTAVVAAVALERGQAAWEWRWQRGMGRTAALVGVLTLAIALLPFHVRLLKGDYYARKVLSADQASDLDAVIENGLKALQADPGNVRLGVHIGRALTEKQRYPDAVAVLTRVVKEQPHWYLALHNLAVAYQRQGKWEEAIATARKAMAMHDQAAETLNVIGCATLDRAAAAKRTNGDYIPIYQEAEKVFQEALAIVPTSSEYYYNRGLSVYHRGEVARAVELMEKSIELNPDYALPYKDLGAMYANDLKDTGRAIELFVKALALKPDIEGAANVRGFLRQYQITPPN